MRLALEILAKMAARSAGYDPDRSLVGQGGELLDLGGLAWEHPKFVAKAESAYAILTALPYPGELDLDSPALIQDNSPLSTNRRRSGCGPA
jgi:hypothetical protein